MAWLGAIVCLVSALLVVGSCATAVHASGWNSAAIVERAGLPVFVVNGRPFFVYGAAFFYERLPRETWETSLRSLRRDLHVNVLDLYVPWNWHELADGEFDFDGHTNPRRDLHEVLRLAHELGFKIVLRPGPVVRNEWRNGGYPAWLLQRPEYEMPLRDILEGRYPATATLQNARSDDAAATWMRNAVHLRYAERWLTRVLHEVEPFSGDVLAVALDDDQGAYIDNQTWPAPHLRAYLEWLRGVVHRATSVALPVFINTYEMKVTASSPVWAMGNWYQSDAFAIGEHDRSQLEFSSGLLHTRPHQPMMMSEFQAGWLQQPEDVLPQAADPSNTLLAMHTLLGLGVRGIINFPAQDTYDPAGWEAPFANGFYAWDAALGYDAATSEPAVAPDTTTDSIARAGASRAVPTAYVGQLVETFGPLLADANVLPDAAIAYLTSAFEPARLENATIAAIADATIAAQRDCRSAGLTCRLVDLRYADAAQLARYPIVLLPKLTAKTGPFDPHVRAALRRYAAGGGAVVRGAGAAALARAFANVRRPAVVAGAGDGATYAEDPATGAGFLALENYGATSVSLPHPVVHRLDGSLVRFPPVELGPRDALLLPVDVPLQRYAAGFARGDVLQTSSCPVVALTSANAGTALTIVRSPTAACTTRFLLAGAPGSHVVSVRSGQSRFDIRPSGRVSSMRDATVPERSEPQVARTLPIRNDLRVEAPPARSIASGAVAYFEDVYRDGFPCVVLENDRTRLVVSPAAGGRAFVFEDKLRGRNGFDTIGALRDDTALQPPPSTTDRIAKYTHQFPAGFFNRPYVATIVATGERAVVKLRYEAPDAYPHGAVFERVITLEQRASTFSVEASASFAGDDALAREQRGVVISSLDAGDPHAAAAVQILPSGQSLVAAAPQPAASDDAAGVDNVAGLFDPKTHDVVMQAWSDAANGRPVTVRDYARHATTSLVLRAGGTTHIAFGYATAATLGEARELLRRFGCGVAAKGDVPAAQRCTTAAITVRRP